VGLTGTALTSFSPRLEIQLQGPPSSVDCDTKQHYRDNEEAHAPDGRQVAAVGFPGSPLSDRVLEGQEPESKRSNSEECGQHVVGNPVVWLGYHPAVKQMPPSAWRICRYSILGVLGHDLMSVRAEYWGAQRVRVQSVNCNVADRP
jgi:hypothetical protein